MISRRLPGSSLALLTLLATALFSCVAPPFEPQLITDSALLDRITIDWCSTPNRSVLIRRGTSPDGPWNATWGPVTTECEQHDDTPKSGYIFYYEVTDTSSSPPVVVLLSTAPEPPINDRRDAMVAAINISYGQQATFTQPHIPAFSTSDDGRVAFQMGGRNIKDVGRFKQVFLYVPEKLDVPFSQSGPGPSVMAKLGQGQAPQCDRISPVKTGEPVGCGIPETELFDPETSRLPSGPYRITMSSVCDPTTDSADDEGPRNPYPCASDPSMDCYDLTLINSVLNSQDNLSELWGREIRVSVSNPKSPNAQIHDFETLGDGPVRGMALPSGQIAEPMVTSDGRLFVARSSGGFYWRHEGDPPEANQRLYSNVAGVDLFYAVYTEEDGPPCDVSKWKACTVFDEDKGRFVACESDDNNLYPVSHAPHHSYMKEHYGFAKHPFRDLEGNPIPDGHNTYLTYPWIDRGGKNLFFTHHGTMLHYVDASDPLQPIKTRYPASCPPPHDCNLDEALDPGSPDNFEGDGNRYEWGSTRGVGVMGLWTHGKAVFFDNNLNHIDYGPSAADEQHRAIELYRRSPGEVGESRVHIGSGRENASGLPSWSTINSGFIQSLEHLWNHIEHARPRTPRDVVWRMSTGVSTDEVVFDDYLDKGMLIYSDMRASFTRLASQASDPIKRVGTWRYHDGFQTEGELAGTRRGSGFRLEPRVANAATTPLLDVPAYGALKGGMARIEPIAMGGVVGRGLWLNGSQYIEYTMPDEPQYDGQWLVGIFVDPRPPQRSTTAIGFRRLLTFPNGDVIHVVIPGDRSVGLLRLHLWAGNQGFEVDIPHEHTEAQWAHLGFAIDSAAGTVEVHVNGFLVEQLQFPPGSFDLAPSGGDATLHVGGLPGASGFVGWLDEFRVQKMDDFNPAHLCQISRGRLSRVDAQADPEWRAGADSYGAAGTSGHARVNTRLGLPAEFPAQYVCFTDFSTPDALPVDRPSDHGLTEITGTLLMPEGPLVHDQPRPDSTENAFCLSCHDSQLEGGLSLDALAYDPLTWTQRDPRRQPMQAPRLADANLPAGWLDLNADGIGETPVAAERYPDDCGALIIPDPTRCSWGAGFFLDQWMHP